MSTFVWALYTGKMTQEIRREFIFIQELDGGHMIYCELKGDWLIPVPVENMQVVHELEEIEL